MVISNRAPAHLLGKRRGGFVVRSIGLVLLAAVLCLTSAFGYAWVRYQGNLTAADISDLLDPNPQDDEDSGLRDISAGQPLTFLVLGSDVREGDSDVDGSGASGEITGMRADTTMIVHISADRQRIDVVSIPRDTLVDIPSCIVRTADNKTTTTKEKPNGMFNSAFAIGGQTGDVGSAAACTMRTLQQEMGLNFNGYIVVDFASFVKSVDAIGGVPMYFEESLHDKYAGLNIEAGCRLLDGKQALALARARKQVGDGSDISRIGRQQELVMAVAQEVLSSNILTDAPSLLKVVDAVSQSVNVSSSLGQLTTIAGLANSLRGVSAQNIHFATMPWDPAGSRVTVNPTADYIWWAINHDVPFEVYDENGFPRARKPEGYTSPAQGNSPSEASATPSSPGGSATEPAGEPSNHETATNTSSEAPEVSGSATPEQPTSPSPSVPVCTRGNAIPAS